MSNSILCAVLLVGVGACTVLPTASSAAEASAPLAEAFRNENTARHRPRLALLWNRTFSDDMATGYRDYVRSQETTNESSTDQADRTQTQFGDSQFATRDSDSSHRSERLSGSEAEPHSLRSQPSEQTSWRLESAFTQRLMGAGARLIDRAVVMRTLNEGRSAGERPDVQSIEAQALLGKADLLLEILLARKEAAPAGMTFRVNVKSVTTGELLTSFVTDAVPHSTVPGAWRAAAYGFEYVRNEPTLEDVGARLGDETLQQLLLAWEN